MSLLEHLNSELLRPSTRSLILSLVMDDYGHNGDAIHESEAEVSDLSSITIIINTLLGGAFLLEVEPTIQVNKILFDDFVSI